MHFITLFINQLANPFCRKPANLFPRLFYSPKDVPLGMAENILAECFGTLSETINGLFRAGYTFDLNVKDECLVCHQTNTVLSPEDFEIDKVYRFEGTSDPDDESVVYAISSSKLPMKGILVNGYGVSADEATTKLIEKLQTNKALSPMETTSNEATPLRPDGDRILNAPLVEMNLTDFIAQLKSESTWADSDRNSVTIFKSPTMRIVLLGLHKNAALKPHKANGVISVQVLDGKIEFTAEGQTHLMEKGQMVALHDNLTHSVLALEESFFLLTLAMNL